MMAIKYELSAAAVLLALSISGARACDDYPEEMALADARDAAKAAQAAAAQQSAANPEAPPPGQTAATSVASAEPGPAHSQATAEPTSAVAR
jgi:hypothetical protein